MMALLAAGLLGGGCVVAAKPIPVPPGLTFAAHTVHGGLVVDRMQNGDTGVAEPEGGWSSLTNPEFDVHFNGANGDRRLVGTGPIVIHRGTSDEGPVSGRVEPSWDDQAIRLTLRPANGPPLTSDVFTRIDGGAGMEELTRTRSTRSTCEEPTRRRCGIPRDGRRLASHPRRPWSPTYGDREGVLPPTIGEGMAVAAAETLGTEVDWIGNNVRGTRARPNGAPERSRR